MALHDQLKAGDAAARRLQDTQKISERCGIRALGRRSFPSLLESLFLPLGDLRIQLKILPYDADVLFAFELVERLFLPAFADVTKRAHHIPPNLHLHFYSSLCLEGASTIPFTRAFNRNPPSEIPD